MEETDFKFFKNYDNNTGCTLLSGNDGYGYKICSQDGINPPSVDVFKRTIDADYYKNEEHIVYYNFKKTSSGKSCLTFIGLDSNLNPKDSSVYRRYEPDNSTDKECESILDNAIEVSDILNPDTPEARERAETKAAQAAADKLPKYWYSPVENKCLITVKDDSNNTIINDIKEGECPAQFTNVKSGRKSRKIERFESNNNLKCKARY